MEVLNKRNIMINIQKLREYANKYWSLAWIISIGLSLILRIPNVHSSSYSWRSHQTELTAFWFVKEGIDLVNYQTPLYGPPWQIPFEFPLFQAIAAMLSKIGLGDVMFSSRLAALLIFYATALILFLLCRKVFHDHLASFVILNLFLWLPYNIYYSTESLIDFLALLLALNYLYFVLLWLDHRLKPLYAFAAIFSGSLAVLVKLTTVPIVIIPLVTFTLKEVFSLYSSTFAKTAKNKVMTDQVIASIKFWLYLFAIAAIPLYLGRVWTNHADDLKKLSVFTEWLASDNLSSWFFSSWSAMLDPNIWFEFVQIADRWLLPYGLQLFALFGIFTAINNNSEEKVAKDTSLLILSVGLSVLLTFVLFINLYRPHQYYLISWSASLCILSGFGLSTFLKSWPKLSYLIRASFIIWVLLFIYGNTKDYQAFASSIQWNTQQWEAKSAWIHQVQSYIPEDKRAVIIDYDWSPTYPYLLERKSMVFSGKDKGKPICKMVRDPQFTLVILADPAHQDKLERVLGCLDAYTEVMPGVFQIQH